MRKVMFVLGALALTLATGAPARADTAVIASNANMPVEISSSVTCTAPLVVVIEQTSGVFALRELWGAGMGACGLFPSDQNLTPLYTNQGQSHQVCVIVANMGPHFVSSQVTERGNTFTVSSPRHYCDGTPVADTIVFTLGTSSISYRHDIYVGGALRLHAQGVLARAT